MEQCYAEVGGMAKSHAEIKSKASRDEKSAGVGNRCAKVRSVSNWGAKVSCAVKSHELVVCITERCTTQLL